MTRTLTASAPPLQPPADEVLSAARIRSRTGILVITALTLLAVGIHGYHPYAEDGGLYLAGVKRVLDSHLYPHWSEFTTVHLRFSLFAPLVVLLVRISHLSLMTVMLALYVAGTWLTLFAAWQIAVRCYSSLEACCGAVSLLALLLTVPVAGTSLMLMDPYVSARSVSTPCSLLALVAVIDIARQTARHERPPYDRLILCIGCMFIAAIVHPLMAAYALGCVLMLAIATLGSRWAKLTTGAALCLITVAAAACLQRLSPVPTAGERFVAQTRTYWFLDRWHWYELVGLAAPLLVLAIAWLCTNDRRSGSLRWLAQACLATGTLAIMVALLFARTGLSNYAVARLQPLRVFQTIYFITIVAVGGALGERVLKRHVVRWVVLMTCLSTVMAYVQLDTFPHSAHLELPWVVQRNEWEQAFLWIRNHTSENAVFALDANYITADGEDSQNFRAIAERSALPDYSKDGGVASIAPDLTAEWLEGERTQEALDVATDAERMAALRGSGVDWVVLSSGAATNFECDYVNDAARVCRVPAAASVSKMP